MFIHKYTSQQQRFPYRTASSSAPSSAKLGSNGKFNSISLILTVWLPPRWSLLQQEWSSRCLTNEYGWNKWTKLAQAVGVYTHRVYNRSAYFCAVTQRRNLTYISICSCHPCLYYQDLSHQSIKPATQTLASQVYIIIDRCIVYPFFSVLW